jgi:hypothetical protein
MNMAKPWDMAKPWADIPPAVEDEVRDAVYTTIQTRRGLGIKDTSPVVFLTSDPTLDGLSIYSHRLVHSPGAGSLARAVQPIIAGEPLWELVKTRARVPVDGSDLDRWQQDVEQAVQGFRTHLVGRSLCDILPPTEDIAIKPDGPSLVLLRWEPAAYYPSESAENRLNQGYEWQWWPKPGRWALPNGDTMADPLRRTK